MHDIYVIMATFRAVILKGKIHVKDDLTTNIKIRVTHNRKTEYCGTDLYINPDYFKNGYASGNNADFINMRILDYLNLYHRRYLDLGNMTAAMTVKELKKEISHDKTESIDFIKFAEEYLAGLKLDGRQGSVRAVRGFISNLKAYRPKVQFANINSQFLQGFEAWMKRKGIRNGVQSYMARFRVIFNLGRERYNDEDRGIVLIANYPFKKYRIVAPVVKARENSLTITQLRKFINYKPVTQREALAQDMFMLMIYLIGPNSKDIISLPKADRNKRIIYNRSKTGHAFSLKFEPEAESIASRYSGTIKLLNLATVYSDYLNFQKAINIGLQSICNNIRENEMKILLKVKTQNPQPDFPVKITSNWARHTWATIARNDCRIPKDDVALCLGHQDTDNRVTDMYIKYDYSIIDEANRKVIDIITKT